MTNEQTKIQEKVKDYVDTVGLDKMGLTDRYIVSNIVKDYNEQADKKGWVDWDKENVKFCQSCTALPKLTRRIRKTPYIYFTTNGRYKEKNGDKIEFPADTRVGLIYPMNYNRQNEICEDYDKFLTPYETIYKIKRLGVTLKKRNFLMTGGIMDYNFRENGKVIAYNVYEVPYLSKGEGNKRYNISFTKTSWDKLKNVGKGLFLAENIAKWNEVTTVVEEHEETPLMTRFYYTTGKKPLRTRILAIPKVV